MAATVTADSSYYGGYPDRLRYSRRQMIAGTIAFDDSYPAGGEDVSDYFKMTAGYFQSVGTVAFESAGGYTFQYDYTNDKVKVFHRVPPIIYEEVHTIASNAITLDYPAAAILYAASAGATQLVIEASDTLAANEVQLSAAMAAGVRPTLNLHASTTGSIKVTYITQAWQEVWANRKAEAALSRVVHVAHFGETVAFLESCHPIATATSITSRPIYVRLGDTAVTLEAEVDFTDAAGVPANSTTLTFVSTDAMTSCTATYIALPASGFLFDRFLEAQDTTIASGVSAALTPLKPILFNSLCGQIPDYTAANERDTHHLQMATHDALGTTGEFQIDYSVRPVTGATGHIKTNDSTSDAVSLTYVYGTPDEIPGLVSLECKPGTDLSGLTAVRFWAEGKKY